MDEDLSISRIHKEDSTGSLSDDDLFFEEDAEKESPTETSTDAKSALGDKMISMNLLDYRKLSNIKRDFMLREEGLLKSEFISIMLHHIPEIKDKVSLVNSLNDLFAEIDVNDDKHLEWDEFSNYIIEIGLVKKDHGFVDIIKNYKQAEWRDSVKHDNDIEYIHYIPPLKQLLVMERDNKKFKVYNMKTGKFEREVRGHQGAVIGAHYLSEYSTVATSSNDLSIMLWDETSYSLNHKIDSPIIPITLANYDRNLYAGGPEGMIYYWNLYDVFERENRENYMQYPKPKEFHHTNAVTTMLPIPGLNILATGDLDGKLLLWDIPSHQPNRKMKELSKGIYSLDWSADVGCLFSAGLERSAYVWNPYVNKWIYKLSGHIHSLVGVKCIPNSHQLITADISGMFKVWDIRTFNCMQSFNAPVAELNCFTVSFPEKKIIAGSKKVLQYAYEEPKDQNKVDETIAICCYYNPQYHTFITAHSGCVKVWNAATGRLSRVFRDLTPGDITALIMDDKYRKMYIGDSQGHVYTFKIKNGARIKEFKQHTGEVTNLLFWPEYKYLISTSWDCRVRVHDDSKSDDLGILRFDKIKHNDIVNSVDLKQKSRLIGSCSDDGSILLTNLRTLRQESELTGHDAEIKNLKFLNPHNCLVACDLSGNLYFWAISPSNVKNTLLVKTQNTVENEMGGTDSSPIQALAWSQNLQTLFTGDDSGNLRQWKLDSLLNKLASLGSKHEKAKSGSNECPDSTTFYMTAIALGVDKMSKINSSDIALKTEWKAHDESILSLSLVEDISIIITCSFDCRVHIWNYSGTRLGTLIVGGDPSWDVKIDTIPKIETARKEAISLLEESQNQTYEEVISQMNPTGKEISDSDESSEEFQTMTDSKKKGSPSNISLPSIKKRSEALRRLDSSSMRQSPMKSAKVSSKNVNKSFSVGQKPETVRAKPFQTKRDLSQSGRRVLSKK
ncbi:unnamed protein product [Blepharisma stoltei]|uniref:EF-hand domain-containing protein n=1 Tax=Blepharisma stoltei TaxID=1481888 RepID=A0AAU9JS01_9CILI|nr:unnamed protein product [Blepharisma stoltei]